MYLMKVKLWLMVIKFQWNIDECLIGFNISAVEKTVLTKLYNCVSEY